MKKYKIFTAVGGQKGLVERSIAKTLEEAMEYVVTVSKNNIIYDKLDEALFDIEVNEHNVSDFEAAWNSYIYDLDEEDE